MIIIFLRRQMLDPVEEEEQGDVGEAEGQGAREVDSCEFGFHAA